MVLIASRKAAEIQFQPSEAFIYILNNNNNTNHCFPSACQALCYVHNIMCLFFFLTLTSVFHSGGSVYSLRPQV